MPRTFYTLILFSLFFAVGCSDVVVIKGTAKMADGTVVERGMVNFYGETDTYRTWINNGTFRPGRMRDGDGIPPGVYKISVSVTHDVEVRGRQDTVSVSRIHSKYTNHLTSELSIDTSKERTLDLVLEPAE